MQQFAKRRAIPAIFLLLSATAALADSQYNPPQVPEPQSVVEARERVWARAGYPSDVNVRAVGRCADEYSSFTDYQACNPELFNSGGSDGGGGSAE